MKFLPAGWDEERVKSGIHTAMGFGEPTRTEDKATFYVPRPADEPVAPGNSEGVPWNPAEKRNTKRDAIQVACAIEKFERADDTGTYGTLQPDRIVITLLDGEYQQVKGFEYVVAGGDRYYYRKTDPPVALGSIDVWTVHATAQDER